MVKATVYFPGCFDLLHVGHVAALTMASWHGDKLIVGVASDEVVEQDKGQKPVIPIDDRLIMVGTLRFVFAAVSYERLEFLTHLNQFKPDVLAVSEKTWGNSQRHKDAEEWCIANGATILRIPHYEGESTTAIKQRIIERGGKQS